MSLCDPALPTKPIPTCIGDLTIGKVSYGQTVMTLFIVDITTGRIEAIDFVTEADGTSTADVSDYDFSDKHSYKAFITREGANVSSQETIYIGTTSTKEVELNFELCFEDGDSFVLPSVTLEVA